MKKVVESVTSCWIRPLSIYAVFLLVEHRAVIKSRCSGRSAHIPGRDQIKTRKRRYFILPPAALLMLPWVAIFRLAASDVWLTLIFATLNGRSLSLFRVISGSKVLVTRI